VISGFSFGHNLITGGYPIVEAVRAVQPYVDEVVVVDCASTDGTRDVLQALGVRILDGEWGDGAGETLKQAHALHNLCARDVVLHFEADEVYDPRLVERVVALVEEGYRNLAVWRLQVEQNFQRCRWYPEPVHRVFPRGSVVKEGHTTNRHLEAMKVGPDDGFLWDVTNCFRDNWRARVEAQAALWGQEPVYRGVPVHFSYPVKMDAETVELFLDQPHWEWNSTPLAIPDILRPLVGKTRYNPEGV
jgi:glycosyltransferase involved in cell wall biosynthesis